MTFTFANCEIDCDRRELLRSGEVTHVEPQVFDVLVHLVRHRDRVVSKDELIQAVWDGRIVSDETITSRVSAARRAIGDSGADQRLIRTVTRRGFRFVGAVREGAAPLARTGVQRLGSGTFNAPAMRQVLPRVGRRAPGRCHHGPRHAAGEDRQLVESHRIRLAQPGVVPALHPAGRAVPAGAI